MDHRLTEREWADEWRHLDHVRVWIYLPNTFSERLTFYVDPLYLDDLSVFDKDSLELSNRICFVELRILFSRILHALQFFLSVLTWQQLMPHVGL